MNGRNGLRASKGQATGDAWCLDWAPTDYDSLHLGGSSGRFNLALFVCVAGIVILALVGLICVATSLTRELDRGLGAAASADVAGVGDNSSISNDAPVWQDARDALYIRVAPLMDEVFRQIASGLLAIESP